MATNRGYEYSCFPLLFVPIVGYEACSGYQNNVPLFRDGLSAKIQFIRCLMPDSGYQISDHGIARAAQALAPRVALSLYISVIILVCNLSP